MRKILILTICFLSAIFLVAQENPFAPLDFMIGSWSGTGTGFGNATSKIESDCRPIMNGQYIHFTNHSIFEPTERNPEGEYHEDLGIISYDKKRNQLIYRQFNIEGYVNRYILNDSLSNDSTLIFETEFIENFVEGGKARITIRKTGTDALETVFEVSMPGREFACFGTNQLRRE